MPIEPSRTRRPRRARAAYAPLALAALAVALVASACLPPGAPDPTGTAPFGHLDSLVADGNGWRARGWVIDPDTTAPIEVTLAWNGRLVTAPAELTRSDVAAAYPAYGARHGFDVRFPDVPDGVNTVCVWAENVGRGTQARALGCTDVDLGRPPRGNLDAVSPREGAVVVAGWAFDPERATPIDVGVSVDGAVVVRRTASADRPDVGAAYGRGGRHGFSLDVPVAPGRRNVCVTAFNVGSGTDQPLGCRAVDVPAPLADRRPTGRVEQARPDGFAVRLAGAASDVDGPVGSVRVSVDGRAPTTVPVSGGRWSTTVGGLLGGPHSLCVTLVDVPSPAGVGGAKGDRALPCSTAVIGPPSVGSAGAPVWTAGVGPGPGHPLERIERDAGVSARLRDGSLLWFFGDSSDVDGDGTLRYFVNNTAAWTAPGSVQTRDAVAAGSRPVPFIDPGPEFPACPAGRTPAMWPLSAVVQPVGALDRVIVFLGNVCLGGFLEITEAGVAVAELWYDPASPPADRPLRGTLLNQVLFAAADEDYGTAAVMGTDGLLYAHACRRPATPSFMVPGTYGPCTVGRVDPNQVAAAGAWRWWNGTAWVADRGAAAGMTMPDGVNGYSVPVASSSLARDPVLGTYVMAYSPWPGFTDRIEVRVASRPEGPWTAPVDARLPGCVDRVAGQDFYCYAGTVQPAFSAPGLLGLGYFDQRLEPSAARGQYRVAQVPVDVVGAT